jgi:hypothetical protein
VEITDAWFKALSATANHTPRHTRIHLGNPKTFLLRFPNLPAETKGVLHVAGRYLGGQFNFNLHVQMP